MEPGREFPFLEVMGTNVLANEVVRHFSNFNRERVLGIDKTRASRKACFGGELQILTHQSTCHDSIYKKGKAQRHFFDELASRGSR